MVSVLELWNSINTFHHFSTPSNLLILLLFGKVGQNSFQTVKNSICTLLQIQNWTFTFWYKNKIGPHLTITWPQNDSIQELCICRRLSMQYCKSYPSFIDKYKVPGTSNSNYYQPLRSLSYKQTHKVLDFSYTLISIKQCLSFPYYQIHLFRTQC